MTTWRGIMMAGMLAFLVTMVPWSEFAQSDDKNRKLQLLIKRVSVLEQQMQTVNKQLVAFGDLQASANDIISALQRGAVQTGSDIRTLNDGLRRIQSSQALALDSFVSINTDTINGLVGPHIIFTGANVHIRDGSGVTGCTIVVEGGAPPHPNMGLGNLVVGYNEESLPGSSDRSGSHNIIVGQEHDFTDFGGFVAGQRNKISGTCATVSGGTGNVASSRNSSVSGGVNNTASGGQASVSGGEHNTAGPGFASSVSGGKGNAASGIDSSVSGGANNTASGDQASVSGGGSLRPSDGNVASRALSSVSGGVANTASGVQSSVSGGSTNTARGDGSHVSGGFFNSANGFNSSILGGQGHIENSDFHTSP